MILGRQEYFSPDSHKSLVDRPLRIAQIAPLYESVPPKRYGGNERLTMLKIGSNFYILASLLASHRSTRVLAGGDVRFDGVQTRSPRSATARISVGSC